MWLTAIPSIDTASTWTKLLFTYGPFALLVFTAFVLEYKARGHKKEFPNDSTGKGIYSLTWVLIFSMAVAITIVWYKMNIATKEFKIRGRLAGLQGDEQLRSRFKLLFIRREYENSATFDYDWIILSNKPLSAGSEVLFIIDRSLPPNHEDLETYKVPILASFYDSDSEVELTYDRSNKTISFVSDEGARTIRTVQPDEPVHQSMLNQWFGQLMGVVYAQSTANLKDVSKRLQATDPIVRLDARAELAQAGSAGLAYIQEVLHDNNSSYFLKLGVISSLNAKKDLSPSLLDQSSVCAIFAASYDDDQTLRTEAMRFLTGNPNAMRTFKCGQKPRIPLNCGESDVRLDLKRPMSTGFKDVTLYLYSISTSDSVDLYIYRRPQLSVVRGANLSHDKFRQLLSSMKSAEGDKLPEGTFSRIKLKSRENVTLDTESGQIRIKVSATHYMSDHAEIRICD